MHFSKKSVEPVSTVASGEAEAAGCLRGRKGAQCRGRQLDSTQSRLFCQGSFKVWSISIGYNIYPYNHIVSNRIVFLYQHANLDDEGRMNLLVFCFIPFFLTNENKNKIKHLVKYSQGDFLKNNKDIFFYYLQFRTLHYLYILNSRWYSFAGKWTTGK